MTRGALGGEDDARRNFFEGLDLEDVRAVLGLDNAAAFVDRKLGVDFGILMRDQPVDAGRAGFFVRFRQQNDIAAQLDVAALDLDHHGELGGEKRFVVLRAAAIDEAIGELGAERIDGPLLAVGRNHVAVRHQQQRPAFAVAL